MRLITASIIFLLSCGSVESPTPPDASENPQSGDSEGEISSPENDLDQDKSLHIYQEEKELNLCKLNWLESSQLHVNPYEIKGYSGDGNAAYGLFTFQRFETEQKFVFKIKGKIPASRFMSIETYEGYLQKKIDKLFDYEIFDIGLLETLSENKNLEMFMIDHGVDEVEGFANISLSERKLRFGQQNFSFFYRIYSPVSREDLKFEDLPEVYAYDADSGDPLACPEPYPTEPFILNQDHVDFVKGQKHKKSYKLEKAPNWFSTIGFGGNSAVPSYLIAFNKLYDNSVSVIRFKAPTYSGQWRVDSPQVRYWSLCANDIATNRTLGCVPDELAKPDKNGWVTVVYAKDSPGIREKVKRLGLNFLLDQRGPEQNTITYNYRNLLAESGFAETDMYKNDYQPKVVSCTTDEFLKPIEGIVKCGLPIFQN